MTQKIHPYLILRLNAVVAAFNDLDAGVRVNRNNYTHIAATSLKEKDDDSDDSGGGGGTMRGHRAKNSALDPKALMRRITRR